MNYDLLRGLHIIAVIAWMSGMMYLPRLYAYPPETAPPGSEFDEKFLVWERKLLKIIIRQMAEAQGINEDLKARDQMAWVGAMNNIKSAALEILLESK